MDIRLILFVSTAFMAVAGVVLVMGHYFQSRTELRRRLASGGTHSAVVSEHPTRGGLANFVAESFTEDRFGVDNDLRQKLRRELIRAGFFNPNAIRYYVFARFCSVILLPLGVFALGKLMLAQASNTVLLLLVAVVAAIGVFAPDAFLKRRQASLVKKNRLVFPDLLDLINVCMSAGLSVEASFDRVRNHIGKRSYSLGFNIELMGAEIRAGRSAIEALNAFASRLGLDEAASFVAVLRHSIDLGGDVAESLRVFSEEMRTRRMLLAETKANELPVKMVLPLSLGIFPVILMIIMLPIMLKLVSVMGR
jgi:tight adherence protein C